MWTLFETLRDLAFPPQIAIFHEFHRPPYGGGNQFLLALRSELARQGVRTGHRPGRSTKAILMNSFNFDTDLVRRMKRKYPHLKAVHRMAGPVGVYRGTDIEVDRRTQSLNAELADATIFQSQYSADAYRKLGLEFRNPVIIHNGVDSRIFHPRGRTAAPDGARRIRLVATAWSDNPKKGGPLLAWLDEHIDHERFELTFVGRTKAVFKNARVIEAVPSEKLAGILRDHDIYIAPSEDDPCSNALLEALACGLPAVYRGSGGHPELVGGAGEPFSSPEEALRAAELVASDWQAYRSRIHMDTLEVVTRKYLAILIP